MNVCFSIMDPKWESLFVERAEQAGLYALKGHKMVGGLRASLYNAMPMAGVDALIHRAAWIGREEINTNYKDRSYEQYILNDVLSLTVSHIVIITYPSINVIPSKAEGDIPYCV